MSDAGLPCCPVCEGERVLRVLDPHLGLRVPLRRCDRCCGIWADSEVVRLARAHYHERHYVMVQGHGRQPCRHCGAVLPGPRVACSRCLADQTLPCVSCKRRMTIVSVGGVAVDVCRPCCSAWFDRGELGLIARAHADELHHRISQPSRTKAPSRADSARGWDAPEVGVDALQAVPDAVSLATHGAQAAGRAALHGTELVASHADAGAELAATVGGAALDAGAAGAELASSATEALLELVAGIFSV